jgi:transcription initiation factor TFIIB
MAKKKATMKKSKSSGKVAVAKVKIQVPVQQERVVLDANKISIKSGPDMADDMSESPRMAQSAGKIEMATDNSDRSVAPTRRCPGCNSTDLVFDNDRSELVCNNCGLVIEENIADNGPEWRAFDAEQRNSRVRTGAPMRYTKLNKGLVTEIDLYNKDIRGVRIPSKRQAQLYRMRKWHKRATIASSSERNYLIALPELNRVSSYLGLPENIRENAALLYRRCVKNNMIRGRPIETVVQAVIYAACRKAGMPRTLDEIASISGLPKKEIGRAYRAISHELDLRIPLTDPMAYVPRYVNALKLSGEAQEKAIELLKDAMKKGLVSGRSPTGVSAAAVYIAGALSGERRTQKEVADVAGVTEVTIRNRYRELKEQLNIDVSL